MARDQESDPAPPWWSRTVFVVVLLAAGQFLLLVAWSSRSAAWASLSPEGGTAVAWPLGILRRVGDLGSVPVILAAALLTSVATLVATRCVHELGGGRGAQLLMALGFMICPLTLRIGTGHAQLLGLTFVVQLFLLGLVRFHRLRSPSSAGLLGLAAALLSVTVPLGWVAGLLGALSAVLISPTLAAVALAPCLLAALFTMPTPLVFHSLPVDASLFSEAILRQATGSRAESLAILGFGLPVLVLGVAGVLSSWRAPGWQRPTLVVAGLSLAVALMVGPTVEAASTGWLLLAAVGAVRIGGQVEVGGRVALALALPATLLLGLLTLPLGLPLLL